MKYGCCEAVHKEIKNYLLTLKEKQKEKFDLDIAIEEALIIIIIEN